MEEKEKKKAEENKIEEETQEEAEPKENNQELTEEEIESLFKELSQDLEAKPDRRLRLLFHSGTHPKLSIHILIMLGINLLTLSSIIGITNYGQINNIALYLLGISLFTIIEVFMKLMVFLFLRKAYIFSLGTINLLYLIPLFYFVIVKWGNITFIKTSHFIFVFAFFLILRFVVSYYIKSITYKNRRL